MFANYPLWLQIVCWGVFMGLNGSLGGTLPFANLAVLSLTGVMGVKYGGWWVALACFVGVAEFLWVLLSYYAAGMASSPSPTYLETGVGWLNILIALVIFFILVWHAKPQLSGPVWVTVSLMTVCYLLGLWFSIRYWNPVFAILVILPLFVMCLFHMDTVGIIAGGFIYFMLMGMTIEMYLNSDHHFREVVAEQMQREVQIKTAIQTSIEQNDTDTLKRLISENAEYVNNSLLRDLAVTGNIESLRTLLKSGAKIDTEKSKGLLDCASETGNIQIVQFLLQQEKNWSYEALGNALYSACAMECLDNVKQLIAAGANVNWQNDWLQTALMETGNIEIAKLLIENGADVTAKDEDDKTVLSYSLQRNRSTEMIAFLLEHGADVNARDKNGKTALEYAIQNHNEAAINLLKQYGAQE